MSDGANPYQPPDAPLDVPSCRRGARWAPAFFFATLSAVSLSTLILGGIGRMNPDIGVTLYGGSTFFLESLGGRSCVIVLGSVQVVSFYATFMSVKTSARTATVWALVLFPISLTVMSLFQLLL